MLIPFLVGLLDRSFQPHLDQMQHRSVDDPSSHRLHQVDVRNTMVGRDGSCDKVACARPPAQNPPSGLPATGSPGRSREKAVRPSHVELTPHKVIRTRLDAGDRTSKGGAADSVVSRYGPIVVVPHAGSRRASVYSGVARSSTGSGVRYNDNGSVP